MKLQYEEFETTQIQVEIRKTSFMKSSVLFFVSYFLLKICIHLFILETGHHLIAESTSMIVKSVCFTLCTNSIERKEKFPLNIFNDTYNG